MPILVDDSPSGLFFSLLLPWLPLCFRRYDLSIATILSIIAFHYSSSSSITLSPFTVCRMSSNELGAFALGWTAVCLASHLACLVRFLDCYLARPPALHPPSSSPILYSPASRKLGASNLCVNTITPFRDTRLLGFEHTLLDNFRDAKIVGHLPDRSLKRAIPCIVRCPSIHHAMVTLDLAAGSDTHGQRGSCPLS